MKFEKHILESFLWETHDIFRGLSVRNAVKKNNNKENVDLCHRLELHNLFLIRRVHDPGFFKHVTQELEKNPEILTETVRYIRKLLDQHVFNDDFLNFSDPQKTQDKILFPDDLAHGMHLMVNAIDLFKIRLIEQENSIKYFERRSQYALQNDLTEEYVVISQLHKDYQTGNYFGFELFTENTKHSEFDDRLKWFSEGMSFFYRNLCWPERYIFYAQKKSDVNYNSQNPQVYDIPLFHFLSCGKPLIEFFLKKFDLPSIFELMDISESEVIRYNKFSNDALSIASEKWFASLTDEEKIRTLNQTYPFTIQKNDFADLDISLLMTHANQLYAQNYFDEASIVFFSPLQKLPFRKLL